MATKYKNHDEFCRAKHLLTTGNCHMKIDCAECKEIWYAAKEENGSSHVPSVGISCKCGNKTFTHLHTNWIECVACNKVKMISIL